MDEFGIVDHREIQGVLPISVALLGYVFGPIVFSPLSETYGRKPILLSAFIIYVISSVACALAPNWPAFLVFRFMVGLSTAAPYAVVGALFADLYSDPIYRGRANCAFLTVSSGCHALPRRESDCRIVFHPGSRPWSYYLWLHLSEWLETDILGCVIYCVFVSDSTDLYSRSSNIYYFCYVNSLILSLETFAPVILSKAGIEDHNDLGGYEKRGLRQDWAAILTRPIRMFGEPIVLFTCLYLAFIFAIWYLFFEAYPIIFQGKGLSRL